MITPDCVAVEVVVGDGDGFGLAFGEALGDAEGAGVGLAVNAGVGVGVTVSGSRPNLLVTVTRYPLTKFGLLVRST